MNAAAKTPVGRIHFVAWRLGNASCSSEPKNVVLNDERQGLSSAPEVTSMFICRRQVVRSARNWIAL